MTITKSEKEYIEDKINRELAIRQIHYQHDECSQIDECLVHSTDVHRKNLTAVECFTIDGPDATELDDAISFIATEQGYELGVHIADVAAYVPDGSKLSMLAAERGTSIYFPGRTISMFPELISKNFCSLIPNTDKRAISMIIYFDLEGNVLNYNLCRSIIRSRVRGEYSEVSSIIEGNADDLIRQKYRTVIDDIKKLYELSVILHDRRAKNGASTENDGDYKYTFIENRLVINATGNTVAEGMICEFMVVANSCMSKFFEENMLPGIYRIQERANLAARYSTKNSSHESLSLCGGYLRYTSPIRRAVDYKIISVLACYLDGMTSEALNTMYLEAFSGYCEQAQRLEERAKCLEKTIMCECNLLYFSRHATETYRGIVVGKDRRNSDSLVEIQPYGIRIHGSSMLTKYVGQEYAVSISVDEKEKRLRVGHISKLSVA